MSAAATALLGTAKGLKKWLAGEVSRRFRERQKRPFQISPSTTSFPTR
jgi:hypothetical protein